MFLLAHLSDPHLGPLPAPPFAELSRKRVLGYLNWQRNRRIRHRPEVLDLLVRDLKSVHPDHIVVTGDLVNLALRAEFAPAREWLSRLGSPHDVTVVPGNHDAYMRDAVRHSGDHWGDYMRGDGIGVAAPPERPPQFPFVRRRGPIALIGLSTAVPTAPFLATGKLGADQLLRLADVLTHLGHQRLFRVVLIHHPPASVSVHRFKRLVDDAALRRVLAEHGAELVLHGHNHVYSLQWLEGPRGLIPAVGVPSASASLETDNDPAAYNLYQIESRAAGWSCEVVRRGFRALRRRRTHRRGPDSRIAELGRQPLDLSGSEVSRRRLSRAH
jgi:3',5'-cyclic AMP phosphodiesterase CpdA